MNRPYIFAVVWFVIDIGVVKTTVTVTLVGDNDSDIVNDDKTLQWRPWTVLVTVLRVCSVWVCSVWVCDSAREFMLVKMR